MKLRVPAREFDGYRVRLMENSDAQAVVIFTGRSTEIIFRFGKCTIPGTSSSSRKRV